MAGRFVVLEGIDGAGTTTQARLLEQALARKGTSVVTTREPSDGPIGTLIRAALTGRVRLPEAAGSGMLTEETVALLFAADRLDHYQATIRPAVERNMWVISDRYLDSSLAYQGVLMDDSWVSLINRHAVRPDLTVFLDVDVDVALARIGASRLGTERFEKRELLLNVRNAYLRLYANHGPEVLFLDAHRCVEDIHQAIVEAIEAL